MSEQMVRCRIFCHTGTARAASNAMITTTIMISTSVKPARDDEERMGGMRWGTERKLEGNHALLPAGSNRALCQNVVNSGAVRRAVASLRETFRGLGSDPSAKSGVKPDLHGATLATSEPDDG